MMSITLLFTGVAFIAAGIFLRIKPPQKRNLLIGYRTARSMRSQAAWDFSQKLSGKVMIGSGTCLLIIALLALPLPIPPFWWEFSLTMAIILAGAFIPIIITERKLKKEFSEDVIEQ